MTTEGSPTMPPLLPTSIVGSLPKPSWLSEPETLWSPWKLEGDALIEGKQDALRIAVEIARLRLGIALLQIALAGMVRRRLRPQVGSHCGAPRPETTGLQTEGCGCESGSGWRLQRSV